MYVYRPRVQVIIMYFLLIFGCVFWYRIQANVLTHITRCILFMGMAVCLNSTFTILLYVLLSVISFNNGMCDI